MRHRERNTVAPYYSNLGTQWYEQIAKPNVWYYSAKWTNGQARTLFPNIRAEHCYDEIHSGPPYLSGGPFNKWTFYTNAAIPQARNTYFSRPYGALRYKYVGGFVSIYNPDASLFSPISIYKNPGNPTNYPGGNHTWGDVSSHGATAWKKYRPGKATADLGVFIGEARDIPRMLKTTARGFYEAYKGRFGRNPKGSLKKAADHWLNHQFGWLPFVSDLRKFYRTWHNADRMIQQIRAQNGQWQWRGGSVSTSSDSSLVFDTNITNPSNSYMSPALGDLYYATGLPSIGRQTLTRITGQKVWFAGRFRYYIPNVGTVQWSETAKQKLFGADVTPSLVWELTPWSWLIDWVSNVGDVFSNATDPGLAQNLAAKYAYVMGESWIKLSLTTKLNSITPVATTFDYFLTRKVRVAANPFGFGLTWDGLSPRQWSILSALGITRMH